jgi:hypothetical protein
MNEELLLVALLAFSSGYIFKALVNGFKTFTATAHFVQKIGYQSLMLLGTSVYKVAYVDQLCALALEKMGSTEEAKKLRLDHQQQFEDWKKEIVEEFKENYPENYKWQLKFDDWDGMMDELTHIYKEKKV